MKYKPVVYDVVLKEYTKIKQFVRDNEALLERSRVSDERIKSYVEEAKVFVADFENFFDEEGFVHD